MTWTSSKSTFTHIISRSPIEIVQTVHKYQLFNSLSLIAIHLRYDHQRSDTIVIFTVTANMCIFRIIYVQKCRVQMCPKTFTSFSSFSVRMFYLVSCSILVVPMRTPNQTTWLLCHFNNHQKTASVHVIRGSVTVANCWTLKEKVHLICLLLSSLTKYRSISSDMFRI